MEQNFDVRFWHPEPSKRALIRDAFDALSIMKNYTGKNARRKNNEEKLTEFWQTIAVLHPFAREDYLYLDNNEYYSAEHVIELKTIIKIQFLTGLYGEEVANDVVRLLKSLGASKIKVPFDRSV